MTPFILTIIAILSFTFLLTGCGDHRPDARLTRAESLMDSRADSALQVLDSIDPAALRHDSDKALYALLLTQAQDKNHMNPSNDSLIAAAVGYYKNSDDHLRLTIATYYQGRVYFITHRYFQALTTFYDAKELADLCHADFYAGLACRGISDIYNETYNTHESLSFARKEVEYLKKSGRQPYINYALNDLTRALLNHECYEDAIIMAHITKDSAQKHNDPYLEYSADHYMVTGLISKNKYDKAIPISEEILKSDFKIEDDSLYYGHALASVGRTQDALLLLDTTSHRPGFRRNYTLYQIYKTSGFYKQAMAIREHLDTIHEERWSEAVHQNMMGLLFKYHQYEKQSDQLRIKAAHLEIWLTIISSILILCIGSCLWILYYKRQKQIINDKVNLALTLQKDLKDRENKLNEKRDALKILWTSQYKLLSEIAGIATEGRLAKNPAKKIANDISSLIDRLSVSNNDLSKFEKEADLANENIYSDFLKAFEMKTLTNDEKRIFLFCIYDFPTSVICILMNYKNESIVYNRKRHLKDKIKSLSDKEAVNRFMRVFEKNDIAENDKKE